MPSRIRPSARLCKVMVLHAKHGNTETPHFESVLIEVTRAAWARVCAPGRRRARVLAAAWGPAPERARRAARRSAPAPGSSTALSAPAPLARQKATAHGA